MISAEREDEIRRISLEMEKRAEAAGIKNFIIILNDGLGQEFIHGVETAQLGGTVHIVTRAVGWERIILCLNALDSALHRVEYIDPGIKKEWLGTFSSIEMKIDRLLNQHRAAEAKVKAKMQEAANDERKG